MSTNLKPPTTRQLSYLKALASRAGQSFVYPTSSGQASREIGRLKQIRSTGFSFAEQAAREANGDVPLYSPTVRSDEITGYGSNCRWSH